MNFESNKENYASRVLNISDGTFTMDKNILLEIGLKYATSSNINRKKPLLNERLLQKQQEKIKPRAKLDMSHQAISSIEYLKVVKKQTKEGKNE